MQQGRRNCLTKEVGREGNPRGGGLGERQEQVPAASGTSALCAEAAGTCFDRSLLQLHGSNRQGEEKDGPEGRAQTARRRGGCERGERGRAWGAGCGRSRRMSRRLRPGTQARGVGAVGVPRPAGFRVQIINRRIAGVLMKPVNSVIYVKLALWPRS